MPSRMPINANVYLESRGSYSLTVSQLQMIVVVPSAFRLRHHSDLVIPYLSSFIVITDTNCAFRAQSMCPESSCTDLGFWQLSVSE